MSEIDPNPFPMLKAELRRLSDLPVAVAPEMDEAILAAARRSYRTRLRRWAWARRLAVGAAAAAIIAIGIRLFVTTPNPAANSLTHPQLAQVADINHDGKVDILDAYTLARHIARHDPLDHAWDINGDGVVDQKDIDLIASLAVQVSGEKRQ